MAMDLAFFWDMPALRAQIIENCSVICRLRDHISIPNKEFKVVVAQLEPDRYIAQCLCLTEEDTLYNAVIGSPFDTLEFSLRSLFEASARALGHELARVNQGRESERTGATPEDPAVSMERSRKLASTSTDREMSNQEAQVPILLVNDQAIDAACNILGETPQ